MTSPTASILVPDDPIGDMRDVFERAGGMAPLLLGLDWSETALGEPRGWPQSLRSAASICLGAKYPIAVYWGSELTLVYNEAWSEIPGDKHPWSLGRSGREVWPDIWHIVGPEFDAALAGRGMWTAGRLLPMERHGYLEEAYFDYNLSPITGEDGRIEGVFNAGMETTPQVLGDRRNRLLLSVSSATADATTVEEACTKALDALAADPATVPFALIHLFDVGDRARLCGTAPDLHASLAIDDVALDDGVDHWRLGEMRRRRAPVVLDDLASLPAAVPAGEWPVPPSSAVTVPIVRGGRSSRRQLLGGLVVGAPGGRPVDDDMLRFLELLGERLAAAISSARIDEEERRTFATEHFIATTLQRSLIPELPSVDGIDLSGRYLPGSVDVEVGGDWYDAVPLPDGRLALVIGDVMGKGVSAAAQMGQLRNALRAYLLEGYSPAEVLGKLNHLTISLSGTSFATVLCMFYDPLTRKLEWCRAGHLPPLVRHVDGTVTALDGPGSPPLAVFPDADFREDSTSLDAGDLLVLYTDGLVERRGEGIDVGLDRLASTLSSLRTRPESHGDDVVDEIVDLAAAEDLRDDVAVLVLTAR